MKILEEAQIEEILEAIKEVDKKNSERNYLLFLILSNTWQSVGRVLRIRPDFLIRDRVLFTFDEDIKDILKEYIQTHRIKRYDEVFQISRQRVNQILSEACKLCGQEAIGSDVLRKSFIINNFNKLNKEGKIKRLPQIK